MSPGTSGYGPGDILLVNDYEGSADFIGALVRDGEQARGDGDAVWTHSAVIVSETGDIVEALQQGVVRSHVSKYAAVQTKVLNLPVPVDDPRRAYAVRFALGQIGDGYGVVDFISLGASILFGNRWSSHQDGKPICSELCARATESVTDHGYPYAAERMMPGDLQRALAGVAPLPPLGFWSRLWLLISTTFKAALGLL